MCDRITEHLNGCTTQHNTHKTEGVTLFTQMTNKSTLSCMRVKTIHLKKILIRISFLFNICFTRVEEQMNDSNDWWMTSIHLYSHTHTGTYTCHPYAHMYTQTPWLCIRKLTTVMMNDTCLLTHTHTRTYSDTHTDILRHTHTHRLRHTHTHTLYIGLGHKSGLLCEGVVVDEDGSKDGHGLGLDPRASVRTLEGQRVMC